MAEESRARRAKPAGEAAWEPAREPAGSLAREPALDAAAMKAFAHPLRLQMFQALHNGGPATATQLAQRLGENTAQTSYHLRQLARHGLVEEDPSLGKGRERWWRAASFSLSEAQPDHAQPSPAAHVLRSAMVDERARVLQAWLADDTVPQPWVQASLEQSTTAILTVDELAALNREVQEVIDRRLRGAKGREPDLRAGAGQLRRVRVYYDSFPLPLPLPPAT